MYATVYQFRIFLHNMSIAEFAFFTINHMVSNIILRLNKMRDSIKNVSYNVRTTFLQNL